MTIACLDGRFWIKQSEDGQQFEQMAFLDVIKKEEAKLEEVKPDEVKPEEAKPEEAKPEEAKPEEVKPDDDIVLVKKEDITPMEDVL